MRPSDRTIDRRGFLTGDALPGRDSARQSRFLHISSAVVTVRPERAHEVARSIALLPETEVREVAGSKIVVVLEGRSTGEVGSRLTTIALMDGVFAANLVFEQIEPLDDHGAES